MNIFSLSLKFLIYGWFAVISQSVFILLAISLALPHSSISVIAHNYAPMLEYPIMSFVLVLAGAMLIDLTKRDIGSE